MKNTSNDTLSAGMLLVRVSVTQDDVDVVKSAHTNSAHFRHNTGKHVYSINDEGYSVIFAAVINIVMCVDGLAVVTSLIYHLSIEKCEDGYVGVAMQNNQSVDHYWHTTQIMYSMQ